MGKLLILILVFSGILLLFHFTGIIGAEETANSSLIQMLLNPSTIKDFGIGTKIILALEGILAVGGAILVGYLTKDLQSATIAPLAIYLLNLMWDFIKVFQKVYAISPVLAVLIISPVLILFPIVIVDWWRGHD